RLERGVDCMRRVRQLLGRDDLSPDSGPGRNGRAEPSPGIPFGDMGRFQIRAELGGGLDELLQTLLAGGAGEINLRATSRRCPVVTTSTRRKMGCEFTLDRRAGRTRTSNRDARMAFVSSPI